MVDQVPAKTGYEKWQDGINAALEDSRWHAWDCEILVAVNEYNRHLMGTVGYQSLDWQIIKAMLWVESGAHQAEWQSKPMQIGVSGDPGLTSLLSGDEGGELIVPPAWKGLLTVGSVRTIPAYNIRAGIGYLLMRMAYFEYRSVPAADTKTYQVIVKSGDSFDRIAKAHRSTSDMLRKLNPTASTLQPGQILTVQKASVRRVITGWRPLSTTSIALRYNSMRRDQNYARKLDYAVNLIHVGKVTECMQ